MRSVIWEFIWAVFHLIFNPAKVGNFVHEDMGLNVRQVLYKYGYPFENHTIITEDGYILELHRIPYAKRSLYLTNRPPILLMHGMMASSECYLTSGPESGLAYYLSERGYDVWLANARGTLYGRKHLNISADREPQRFFDFSFHEIGCYDLPAIIDHIIQTTGQSKIFYLGHSQGATAYFIMMSEKPRYNDKIRLMIGLAPVVYTTNSKSPALTISAAVINTVETIVDQFSYHEFLQWTEKRLQFANRICRDGSILQQICIVLFYSNGGFNQKQLNTTLVPLLMSQIPAGAATKQLLHYAQLLNSDEFQQYDHGPYKNMLKYTKPIPPVYNLGNVRTPVALYYSNNDWFADLKDLNRLVGNLPNVVQAHRVQDDKFAHYDFIMSINVKELVYDHLLEILNKF